MDEVSKGRSKILGGLQWELDWRLERWLEKITSSVIALNASHPRDHPLNNHCQSQSLYERRKKRKRRKIRAG